MAYNYFGATEAGVLRKFAIGGYTPTADEFGGAQAVADALADATFGLVQAFPLVALDALQRPDLCNVEARGTEGQTVVAFPAFLRPITAGRVHVWRGMPSAFTSRPVLNTDPWQGGGSYGSLSSPTPSGPVVELPPEGFTVTATGVTLASGLARNEQVFASWDVTVEDAAYAVPSVADWVETGAAASLGPKVYAQATAQWEYVAGLVAEWTATLAALGAGDVVPADLRTLRWWKAPERAQDNTVGSVRRYRA